MEMLVMHILCTYKYLFKYGYSRIHALILPCYSYKRDIFYLFFYLLSFGPMRQGLRSLPAFRRFFFVYIFFLLNRLLFQLRIRMRPGILIPANILPNTHSCTNDVFYLLIYVWKINISLYGLCLAADMPPNCCRIMLLIVFPSLLKEYIWWLLLNINSNNCSRFNQPLKNTSCTQSTVEPTYSCTHAQTYYTTICICT